MAIYIGDRKIAGSSFEYLSQTSLCSISQNIIGYAFDTLSDATSSDITIDTNMIVGNYDSDDKTWKTYKATAATMQTVFGNNQQSVTEQTSPENYVDVYDGNTYFNVISNVDISAHTEGDTVYCDIQEVTVEECMLNIHVQYSLASKQQTSTNIARVELQIKNSNTDQWIPICQSVPYALNTIYEIDRHIKVGSGLNVRIAGVNFGSQTKFNYGTVDFVYYRQNEPFPIGGKTYKINIPNKQWVSNEQQIVNISAMYVIQPEGVYYTTSSISGYYDKNSPNYYGANDKGTGSYANVILQRKKLNAETWENVGVGVVKTGVKNYNTSKITFNPVYVNNGDTFRVYSTYNGVTDGVTTVGSYKPNTTILRMYDPSYSNQYLLGSILESSFISNRESKTPNNDILRLKFDIPSHSKQATVATTANVAQNIFGFGQIRTTGDKYLRVYGEKNGRLSGVDYYVKCEDSSDKYYNTFATSYDNGNGTCYMQISGDITNMRISDIATTFSTSYNSTSDGLVTPVLKSVESFGSQSTQEKIIIEDYCFYGASAITEMDMTNIGTLNGYATFAHCKSLQSVKLPKDVNFDENMFYNCTSLTSIEGMDEINATSIVKKNVFFNLPIKEIDMRKIKTLFDDTNKVTVISKCADLSCIILNNDNVNTFKVTGSSSTSTKSINSDCKNLYTIKICNVSDSEIDDARVKWNNILNDCYTLAKTQAPYVQLYLYRGEDVTGDPGEGRVFNINPKDIQ